MDMDKNGKPESARRMGLIEWLKTYGYYYKGWMWVGIFAVVLVLAIIFLAKYTGADARIYTLTETAINQEGYYNFYQKMNDEYVYDVDGDNNALIRTFSYTLDNSQDSEDLSKLPETVNSAECLYFIVDDAGYDYLKNLCTLRELSYFGIESDADDPYRLTLSGTDMFVTDTLPENTHYYLVMKYIEDEEYKSSFISGYTDIIVGMARNNDKSEDNDVIISK